MTESLGAKPSHSPGARATTVIAGTYRLSHKLGGGAMGEVYEAEHVRLGRRVAVKFLRADSKDDQRAVRRFQSETRALATLRSDHIVSVLDCGELEDGTPYIVMERLEGEDLRRLLERTRPLALRRAVHLALDVCRGLSVVHAAGIVHRDLKPANLFVTKGGRGEDVCQILDFGVAKLVGSDSTHQDALLGTIRYMAPEQIRSGKEVGPPADLYALGAILYECVAGASARTSESREALMFEVLNGPPVPLSNHSPSVPAKLEDLVMKALASEPSERFESASAMAAELEAVLGGPVGIDSTEPDESSVFEKGHSSRARAIRSVNRHQRKLIVGAAAVGLLVGWFTRGLGERASTEVVAAKTAVTAVNSATPPETLRGDSPSSGSRVLSEAVPSVAPSQPVFVPSALPVAPASSTVVPRRVAPRGSATPRKPTAPAAPPAPPVPTGIDISSPYSSDVHAP